MRQDPQGLAMQGFAGIFRARKVDASERGFYVNLLSGGLDNMARPKSYTPEQLRRAADKYFRSISRRREVTEQVPTGARDENGHAVFVTVPVINQLGKPVRVTEFLEPPTVAGLCEALHIHRSTWALWTDGERYPEMAEVTDAIRERLRAWNERELLTRPGKDIRGIVFNLQQNYGWSGEKVQMECGTGALETFLREEREQKK